MSLLNKTIEKLPIELHIPGYKFCGPGTKLNKRLARGDEPRNPLDLACKEHDISYNNSPELSQRHKADNLLKQKAWERVKAKDSSFGERLAALGVAAAMKGKVSLGMGHKKAISFQKMAKTIAKEMKTARPSTPNEAILAAIKSAQQFKKRKVKVPRIISLPVKVGGFIPLIPIFSALAALGAMGGAAANIAGAVNKAKEGLKTLAETKRHNEKMEAIAIGKGLYLTPYKKGRGLIVKHSFKGCNMKPKNGSCCLGKKH